jgi:LmbE family N-acetylglucosaminyl deacetylase
MRSPNSSNKRKLALFFAAAAFPAVYFTGAAFSFVTRNREHNLTTTLAALPNIAEPTAADRLLIIAPHCDDEVLACGGLIQRTLAAGGKVEVIVVTNGDGYPSAVARQKRVVHAEPADFIQFAEQRQQESLSALNSLGIGQASVHFLGYPDGGLMSIWTDHWLQDSAYRSQFTGTDHSPYPITFAPGHKYCGADLSTDIAATIRGYKPTRIISAHPVEDHTDHAAVGTFTELAVLMVQQDPKCADWSGKMELKHYLVHRGDWPTPQGLHKELPLMPPAPLTTVDTAWSKLLLTPQEEDNKRRAIQLHHTQTALMPAFMDAFVRKTEIFGDIPRTPLQFVQIGTGTNSTAAATQMWQHVPPTILDASRDTVLRDLQGGGDILSVTAMATQNGLIARIKTRRPAHGGITIKLHMRIFNSGWQSTDKESTAICNPIAGSDGTVVEASLPWKTGNSASAGPYAIALWANSRLTGVEIDRTEVRVILLPQGASK